MSRLRSIGQFAEITGLTTKALRLYDRLGLLKPAVVDFASGYRYYSPDQTPTAQQIRRLRRWQMPLTEIQVLLRADDDETVRSCLDRHRERITQLMAEYERTLNDLPTAEEWCLSTRKDQPMTTETTTYQCSFCGKDNASVERMIAGPHGVVICNECVSLCNEIIAQEEGKVKGA